MVATASSPQTMSPEQFLELPDRERYELVNGELVEVPAMSMEGSAVVVLLIGILNAFVRQHRLGVVYSSDASYQCFPHDPSQVRRPDLSFIAKGRMSREQFERGHCRLAPDFVVEVLSPGDEPAVIGNKVEEYLEAGVRLVWLINPMSRTAEEYRLEGHTEHVRRGGTLSADPVLDGLRIPLADILPDPQSIL